MRAFWFETIDFSVPDLTKLSPSINELRAISVRFLLLLIGLYINRTITDHVIPAYHSAVIWFLGPIFLAVALARDHFNEAEKQVVRLWQLVGLLSAVYSLLHYPLMPPLQQHNAIALYTLLLFGWTISLISGILCFWIPSLSILPPAFLFWGNIMGKVITGLPITTGIDVQPLTEVSLCIGLGLFINQVLSRRSRLIWNSDAETLDGQSAKLADTAFPSLLLLIAIAVHLANYYWSFYQKMSLDGPWFAWLIENNPVYIFAVSHDDGHLLFSGYPSVVALVCRIVDGVHVYSNFWVLLIQGAAITAFFIPRRAFVVLLLMFDAMHGAIILITGANFWPWIILNVIIVSVVARPGFGCQSTAARLIATGFVLIAAYFVEVTMLGWYDSGANNKLYFEAVDDIGKHYAVPNNFFTFYSYSIGHMDYGSPDPASAFATGEPNGGVWNYRLFRAGRSCDVAALNYPEEIGGFDQEALSAFVRNYHRLALLIESKLGSVLYYIYTHHYYDPFSKSEDFYRLDKHRIVAYIYRRESVCLSIGAGAPQRKIVSSAEYRIDIKGISHEALSGS